MEGYVKQFKTTLKRNFLSVHGRELEVECGPIKQVKKKDDDEDTAPRAQGGVEEKKEMYWASLYSSRNSAYSVVGKIGSSA
jgi:hypothetical protein